MIRFRTATGRAIDLEHPQTADIDVLDIAVALSNICRFTGQIRGFYSVASHAVMVSQLVPPRLRFAALHHDDSEAYLGDVSRNLKQSKYMQGYRVLEERMVDVVERALAIVLTDDDRDAIKDADNVAAIWERCMFRRGMAWNPAFEIAEALETGFVRGTYEDLLPVGELLTAFESQVYAALDPSPCAAADRYLALHRSLVRGTDERC